MSTYKGAQPNLNLREDLNNVLYINASHNETSLVHLTSKYMIDQLTKQIRNDNEGSSQNNSTDSEKTYSVKERNLWEDKLVAYNVSHPAANFRLMNGKGSPEDEEHFRPVREIAEELNTADVLVIAAPVWNFSFPYVVKQYMDIAFQPGINFVDESASSADSDGNSIYIPVTSNKSLVIVSSSGGSYNESIDFLTPYLIKAFQMVGFDHSHVIQIQRAAFENRENLTEDANAQADIISANIKHQFHQGHTRDKATIQHTGSSGHHGTRIENVNRK